MCFSNSTFIVAQAVADAVVVEVHQGDARDVGRQEAGELQDGLRRVAQEAGDGGVGDRAAARPAPPVALLVGGDGAVDGVAVGLVEQLHGDMVGIAVARLHLVGIKPGREEQHFLAARGVQDLVDIGGDARVPRQRPQRRRFQRGEVPVAAAHFQNRRDPVRVAAIGGDKAVLHGQALPIWS